MVDTPQVAIGDDAKQTRVAMDEFFRLRTSEKTYNGSAKFDDEDARLCERIFDSVGLSTRARRDAKAEKRKLLTTTP